MLRSAEAFPCSTEVCCCHWLQTVKLETRIPAGFLSGLAALIPDVAGINLEVSGGEGRQGNYVGYVSSHLGAGLLGWGPGGCTLGVAQQAMPPVSVLSNP